MDEQMKIRALEREKEEKLGHYMKLQDRVDAMNKEIYEVCCGIEELNTKLETAKKALGKAVKQKAPRNGKRKPPKR